MKKEFRDFLVGQFEVAYGNVHEMGYVDFDCFYAELGYEYCMEHLLQNIGINGTSDLMEFMKNKNIEEEEREAFYKQQKLFYRIQDAKSHISDYLVSNIEDTDVALGVLDKLDEEFAESIAEIFIENHDCNVSENDQFYRIVADEIRNFITSKDYLLAVSWSEEQAEMIAEMFEVYLKENSLTIEEIIDIIGDDYGDNLIGIYDEKYFNTYISEYCDDIQFNDIKAGEVFSTNYYKTKDGEYILDIQL